MGWESTMSYKIQGINKRDEQVYISTHKCLSSRDHCSHIGNKTKEKQSLPPKNNLSPVVDSTKWKMYPLDPTTFSKSPPRACLMTAGHCSCWCFHQGTCTIWVLGTPAVRVSNFCPKMPQTSDHCLSIFIWISWWPQFKACQMEARIGKLIPYILKSLRPQEN